MFCRVEKNNEVVYSLLSDQAEQDNEVVTHAWDSTFIHPKII